MAHKNSESARCRFKLGDEVRVKQGVRDPDFPDIPLGGWAGTVKEVHQAKGETTLLVDWNRATLKGMHPIYRNRCERDGLELEQMWLSQDDLEPDDGTPVAIEQPTAIVTKPLSEKDQDDRVRMALGLTHDDPLPDVSEESLLAYRNYLAANLKMPIEAKFWVDTGQHARRRVTVKLTRLSDPESDEIDEEYGLTGWGRGPDDVPIELQLDEIELGKKDPNRRLLEDYSYWFHNWR